MVVRFVSQPVLPVAQRPYPWLHCQPQLPPAQAGVALVVEHANPQLPQFWALVVGSVQLLEQQSVCVPVHAIPQPLQLKTSLVSLTQNQWQLQLVLLPRRRAGLDSPALSFVYTIHPR